MPSSRLLHLVAVLSFLLPLAPAQVRGAGPESAPGMPGPVAQGEPTPFGRLPAVAAPHAVPNDYLGVTEFPISASSTSQAPMTITQGGDGNLWFTESGANHVGRITPTGTVTEFNLVSGMNSYGITLGGDGNMWFTENGTANWLSKVAPNGAVTEHIATLPGVGRRVVYGPDGNYWVADSGQVSRVTPAGVVTNYMPPGSPLVTDITVGLDGNIWFTDFSQNKFGKLLINGSSMVEYATPTTASGVYGITRGVDGKMWISEKTADRLASFAAATPLIVSELPVVTGANPTGIGASPDGTVWYTGSGNNTVGTIDGPGGLNSPVVLPTASSSPDGMWGGPDDGFMWFVERSSGKIARVEAGTYNASGTLQTILPALQDNAYGGYTSVVYVKNINAYPIMVNLLYFDAVGNQVGAGNNVYQLLPNANWTVRQDNSRGLPNGVPGFGAVVATGQVSTFVNEFAPNGTDASSYSGLAAADINSTIYVPVALRKAYGGQYTTGIGFVPFGTTTVSVDITFRDAGGLPVGPVQHFSNLGAYTYTGVYQGDNAGLPDGFAGSAEITVSAGAIGAIVNEIGPNGQFSSYRATGYGFTAQVAPTLFRNAFGGYNTGLGLLNTTGTAGTVTLTYYDTVGTPSVRSIAVQPHGTVAVYQGAGGGVNAPAADGSYTAQVAAGSGVTLVGIVNELAPDPHLATSYNLSPGGASLLHGALVENAGSDNLTTAVGVMNTASSAQTVTLTLYDAITGLAIGSATKLVPAFGFWSWYQGDLVAAGSLPAGTRAAVSVSGTSFAMIVNEVGTGVFMSYNGTYHVG